MFRRKRPPRRLVSFRCPLGVLRLMAPYIPQFRGGRSGFLVASVLAMVHKLGREGAVPLRRRPCAPGCAPRGHITQYRRGMWVKFGKNRRRRIKFRIWYR